MVSGLSVIMPAYNEAGNIEAAISEVVREVSLMVPAYEVIVVDDGSTDDTHAIVREIAQRHQEVTPLCHGSNKGKGAALATGIRNSRMDWILMIDADRQILPSDLDRFLPYAEDYDVIIAYRRSRADSLLRRLLSKGYGRLVSATLKVSAKDLNCPFKLFRKSLINPDDLLSRGFLIDAELLLRALWAGCRIKEVGVVARPRLSGRSSVRLRHVPETLRELRALLKDMKRHGR
ncbi:MAG: hypothetical protein OHK006_06350 [Thermodesulfovibrionales bacterium]